MPINHSSCECKASATFFCLEHLVFICERHVSTHNCSLETIEDFIGHLEHQKKRIDKRLNELRQELKREACEVSELKVLTIKQSQKLIYGQFEDLIEYYSRSLEKVCEQRFNEKISALSDLVSKFNNRQYIEFYRLVKATSQESMKESLNLAFEEARQFLSKDLIFQSISEFSQMILIQLKSLQNVIDSNLNSIALGSIDEPRLRFLINDMIVKENKFSLVEQKVLKFDMKRRLSVLADYVYSIKDKNQKGTTKEPQRRNTRERALTMVKPLNELEESLVEKSFSISENSESHYQSGRRLNPVSSRSALTDFSFETDEILSAKASDDEEMQEVTVRPRNATFNEETLRQKFERSHEGICCLMDTSLYEFNCDGFFDKHHKQSVNVYLEMFKTAIEESLMELKNNFNRL